MAMFSDQNMWLQFSIYMEIYVIFFSVARVAAAELVIPKAEFTSNALKTLHQYLREYTYGYDDNDNGLEPRIVPTTS